ncbi:MAG: polymer-forming cytoskeletal protein [Spirochaetaceae bacterium]|nr:polymer-forming cytoskeletal protein [Spirochaetaceae bacterium]
MREKEQKISVLGTTTAFKGRMVFSNSLIIKGRYDGEIEAEGNILIEETATVRAKVKADNLELFGQLHGDVELKGKLELSEKAVLQGNVTVKGISIEQGAIFSGHINMLKDVDLVDVFSTGPAQLKKLLMEKI